jgi:hypothetical protein
MATDNLNSKKSFELIPTQLQGQSTTTNVSEDLRNNWSISTPGRSTNLYALAIMPMSATSMESTPSESEPLRKLEYVFTVNPKSIDMDEPVAVNIQPTQDGSQFIEHQGSLYKTITIRGTTGVRPEANGAAYKAGDTTGFDDFMNLRNLFRNYMDIKRDPNLSYKYKMVWQNGKEGEFYQVEPISFRTPRDASSPITFNYEIQLRTIRKLEFVNKSHADNQDSHKELTGIARFNERLSESSKRLSKSITDMKTNMDKLSTKAQVTVNRFITNGTDVLNAVTNVINGANRILGMPRSSISLLSRTSQEFFSELQDFDYAVRGYGTTPRPITANATTATSVVSHASKEFARSLTQLFNIDELYLDQDTSIIARRQRPYSDPALGNQFPRKSKDPTNVLNTVVSQSKSVATVSGNDNIYSLAYRLLGDASRWKELVIANKLSPPYVDPTGDGRTVLRPLDPILYPSASSTADSSISPDLLVVDPLIARLGRDVKVVSYTELSGTVLLDLEVCNTGDLSVVEGLNNIQQAIELRFSTEQGSLPLHPTYGVQAPIGSKMKIRTLVGWQINVRSSLLSDERINSINKLAFDLNGNVLSVKANLTIADVNQSLAVNFDTRR